MWQWLLKYFGISSKKLEAPPDPLMLSLRESEIKVNNSSLYDALHQAKEEALEPKLPPELEKVVEVVLNDVIPASFKEALITKQSLFLIGPTDLKRVGINKHYDNAQWHAIKSFAIKSLINNGIKAEVSSGGEYISLRTENILSAIKDYNPQNYLENDILPEMNSTGIYR